MRVSPFFLFLRPAVVASLAIHGGVAAVAVGRGAPGPTSRSVERDSAVIAFEPAVAEASLPSSAEPTSDVDASPSPFELPEVRAALPEFEPADVPVEGTIPPMDDGPAAPALLRSDEGVTSRTIAVRVRPATSAPPAAVASPSAAARAPSERARVVAPPRTLSTNRAPNYPAEARAQGLEGVAMLRVTVRADGSVATVELKTTSGHPSLDRAALEAARGWAFTPPRIDDATVPMTVDVPIAFRLY